MSCPCCRSPWPRATRARCRGRRGRQRPRRDRRDRPPARRRGPAGPAVGVRARPRTRRAHRPRARPRDVEARLRGDPRRGDGGGRPRPCAGVASGPRRARGQRAGLVDRGGATRCAAHRAAGDGLARHADARFTRTARPAQGALRAPGRPRARAVARRRVPDDAPAGAAQPGRRDAAPRPDRSARSASDEVLASTPEWVGERDPSVRRVAITLGTAVPDRAATLAALVDGVRRPGRRGRGDDGARDRRRCAWGRCRANVRVEAWVPMSGLLPTCDVLAFHGGSGTMLAALAAGVPLVTMPVAADQPENADRCVAAGVGVTLGAGERDPAAVRRAVELVAQRAGLCRRRGGSVMRSAPCRPRRRCSATSSDSWHRARSRSP